MSHSLPFLLLLLTFITIVKPQFGLFGCMSTLNTNINCPIDRTFEINIFMGNDPAANSDNIDITATFYDIKKNIIASLPLKWPNCNPYEKGNIQTLKGCANWVEIAKTVTFTVQKPDQIQVDALTIALGQRTATQTNFWFNQKVLGTYQGMPTFNKLQLTPICAVV